MDDALVGDGSHNGFAPHSELTYTTSTPWRMDGWMDGGWIRSDFSLGWSSLGNQSG